MDSENTFELSSFFSLLTDDNEIHDPYETNLIITDSFFSANERIPILCIPAEEVLEKYHNSNLTISGFVSLRDTIKDEIKIEV